MIEASIENKEQNLIKYDKVSMVSRTRMLLPIPLLRLLAKD
jgi:hypothetical protein